MSTKKKTRIIAGALALVLIVGLFFWPSASESLLDEEETLRTVDLVSAGQIVSEKIVSSTLGTVQSLQDVSVRAETAGQIVNININEGDTVVVGQVLLELERQSLDAQVLQAQARLSSAQAAMNKLVNGERPEDIQIIEQKLIAEKERFKELERGSRPEELAVSKTSLENSQKNLKDTRIDLENTKEKAERDVEAQLQKSVDLLQSSAVTIEKVLSQNLQDVIYPIRFPTDRTCQLQLSTFKFTKIEAECFDILNGLDELKEISNQYSSLSKYGLNQILSDIELSKEKLQELRDFTVTALEVISNSVELAPFGQIIPNSLTDETLTSLRTGVTTGQNEVDAKINQLTAQIEALKNQEIINQTAIDAAEARLTQSRNSLDSSKRDLTVKEIGASDEQLAIQRSQIQQLELQLKVAQDGARSEDIQSQGASVQQAQADVALAIANRNKAVIRAPISGTVLQFNFDVGDYLSNGEEVLLMADRERLEVITYVTEDERRFIERGSPVQLLEDTVKGSVTRISPALDRQTKKIEVTITVEEGQEELVIGQTVFAGFELVMDEESVRVPLETVKVVGNSAFVFTVNEESRISIFPVTAGRIIGETIVVSGINPGMLVIPDVSNLEGGQEVLLAKRELEEGIEQVYLSIPNKYPEALPQLSPQEA
jgi:multidrug efflux pump subunit AcrA (membrane-fusion protein)